MPPSPTSTDSCVFHTRNPKPLFYFLLLHSTTHKHIRITFVSYPLVFFNGLYYGQASPGQDHPHHGCVVGHWQVDSVRVCTFGPSGLKLVLTARRIGTLKEIAVDLTSQFPDAGAARAAGCQRSGRREGLRRRTPCRLPRD